MMKIDPHTPVYASALRERKRKQVSSSGGGFSDMLDGIAESEAEPQVEAPARVAAPPLVGGILAVQEVSADATRRGRTLRRGHDLLDALEELKLSLLLGEVSVQQLEAIREQMRAQKETVRDPQLHAVMNEIEIRAAVELAKLGM